MHDSEMAFCSIVSICELRMYINEGTRKYCFHVDQTVSNKIIKGLRFRDYSNG